MDRDYQFKLSKLIKFKIFNFSYLTVTFLSALLSMVLSLKSHATIINTCEFNTLNWSIDRKLLTKIVDLPDHLFAKQRFVFRVNYGKSLKSSQMEFEAAQELLKLVLFGKEELSVDDYNGALNEIKDDLPASLFKKLKQFEAANRHGDEFHDFVVAWVGTIKAFLVSGSFKSFEEFLVFIHGLNLDRISTFDPRASLASKPGFEMNPLIPMTMAGLFSHEKLPFAIRTKTRDLSEEALSQLFADAEVFERYIQDDVMGIAPITPKTTQVTYIDILQKSSTVDNGFSVEFGKQNFIRSFGAFFPHFTQVQVYDPR